MAEIINVRDTILQAAAVRFFVDAFPANIIIPISQIAGLGLLARQDVIEAGQIRGGIIQGVIIQGVNVFGTNIEGGSVKIGNPTPSTWGFRVFADGFTAINQARIGILEVYGVSGFNTVWAHSVTANRIALWGQAEVSASGCDGVRGNNSANGTSGRVGLGTPYDFYADGSGTNYGPFTGAHDVLIPNGATWFTPGDIMVDVQCMGRRGISNTIFEVEPSLLEQQKGVIGVAVVVQGPLSEACPSAFIENRIYTDKVEYSRGKFNTSKEETVVMSSAYDLAKADYTVGTVNAVGEGQINVCGRNGNIEKGDWICTSSISGKGQKQSDDLLRNYTVAKSRETVTFDTPDQVKLIACTYHCG